MPTYDNYCVKIVGFFNIQTSHCSKIVLRQSVTWDGKIYRYEAWRR